MFKIEIGQHFFFLSKVNLIIVGIKLQHEFSQKHCPDLWKIFHQKIKKEDCPHLGKLVLNIYRIQKYYRGPAQ